MFVTVTKGINKFVVNLSSLGCTWCDSHYKNQPAERLSWMCPHISLAIFENEKKFKELHPKLSYYFPVIKQHAQSNTDYNMPNIKNVYEFDGVKLFESANEYDEDNRSHEFMRVAINSYVYTIWLPEMQWCLNTDMIGNPLLSEDMSKAEKYIFKSVRKDLFTSLNRITLKNTEALERTKIGKAGLKFVGESESNPAEFRVTAICKIPQEKIRLNLNISGWGKINGTKIAYYNVAKHHIEFNHRALYVFEKQLLDWCSVISSVFLRIYNIEK